MMDCKKALAEANGDLEAASDALRKRGLAKAAKKAGRTAADGSIGYLVSNDKTKAVLTEINCETDFVTKVEDFQSFVKEVTNTVCDKEPADLDALFASDLGGRTVKDIQVDMVAKIGENISVRRFACVKAKSGQKLSQYIHPGDKLGVIVLFNDPNNKLSDELARDVAMHIAAMNPHYIRNEEIPSDVVEKEKEIQLAQMGEQKKPKEILEKIVSGKLNKYFQEICLDDQIFVKDLTAKKEVSKVLKEVDAEAKVLKFVRFQVGEGVEKK